MARAACLSGWFGSQSIRPSAAWRFWHSHRICDANIDFSGPSQPEERSAVGPHEAVALEIVSAIPTQGASSVKSANEVHQIVVVQWFFEYLLNAEFCGSRDDRLRQRTADEENGYTHAVVA